MSKVEVNEYKLISLKNGTISMDYDSKKQEIYITIERRLNTGDVIGRDSVTIHTSYMQPISDMFKELANHIQEGSKP